MRAAVKLPSRISPIRSPGRPRAGAFTEFEKNGQMNRCLGVLLLTVLTLSAAAGTGKGPKDQWTDWFQRAADQMDLRAPGSTPFHMKVTFHALPGIVLSKKESEQIISGDGTYEETWVTPTRWRREVTFGSYHAIEVQSEAGRKMQASSDYEPSRVLMLLEALLYPIPRDLTSPSLADEHYWWKIENGAVGSQSYVKISRTFGTAKALIGYLFLPQGGLIQRINLGIVTDWTNSTTFGGKLVPQHIRQQGGTRDLLTADVTVEPAGPVDRTAFEVPGGPAEAGMTLRPLHYYEVHGWDKISEFHYITMGPDTPHGNIRRILDRHGVSREVEIIYWPNPADVQIFLPLIRKETFSPVTIDKTPCEFDLSMSF